MHFTRDLTSVQFEVERKLEDIVGMRELKDTLRDYLRDAMVDRLCRDLAVQHGYKRPVMIFTGNPGTGKTSVAQLVAG